MELFETALTDEPALRALYETPYGALAEPEQARIDSVTIRLA